MKEITVEATFKGQNGSLGYKTGTKYDLMITHKKKGNIIIQDVKQAMPSCEYESIISFAANWDNINWKKIATPETVVNFIDFCKIVMPTSAASQKITKAINFYQEEFTPEKVMDYFKNWSMKKQPNLRKVTLTNKHSNGKWSSKIIIHDGAEYTFVSGTPISEEDYQWMYVPKTMSEFISDCLRHEDVDLLFSEKAIKKIYE